MKKEFKKAISPGFVGRKAWTLVLLIALAGLLQACFSAKNYERPALPELNDDLYRTDRLPEDSISMADFTWKQLFTDPVLAGHIEQGLENNLDIRMAIRQIEIANAYFKQGKSGYQPALNVQAQVTHQELSANSQFGSFFDGGITQYELTGTLSWEADIWGKIRSNKRASQAAYLQTVAAHKAVKTQLVAGIATMYYHLLTLDEQLQIIEKTIDNRKKSLETTIALKDAGIVTEVAVQQTRAQWYNAEALRIDLQRDIALAENTLSLLLGKAPGAIERNKPENHWQPGGLKTGYPIQLLSNRPDVIAAEYRLIEAFELVNVARSNFYPSLNISVTSGFQSLELDRLLSANSIFATFVGSLAQPVLNRRQVKTQYEVARSRQEMVFLQFKQVLLDAGKEVADALYAFEAAENKIDFNIKEFEAHLTATTYSEELLDNGMANYLEVLTARENALNAELRITSTRFDQWQAVVELYRALGGGWE